ncbi:helix-turn-helix domain-containing protein [uncultured Jannaschia sp.]|uniref:helix-turn-helix domain-containing protein n=1 Tax=uncultured Jannaschia sp. TaxID=293347 RepID=UPI002620317A|nr:helix-turn-helix domain-containing protein [uncultured Jannaschia sp.]
MNEVMTEPEAARYLRRSVKTLQRRRRDKQISFVRDGGIRYLRSDLDAYLEARRIAATQAPSPPPAPKYRASGAPGHDVVDLLYG